MTNSKLSTYIVPIAAAMLTIGAAKTDATEVRMLKPEMSTFPYTSTPAIKIAYVSDTPGEVELQGSSNLLEENGGFQTFATSNAQVGTNILYQAVPTSSFEAYRVKHNEPSLQEAAEELPSLQSTQSLDSIVDPSNILNGSKINRTSPLKESVETVWLSPSDEIATYSNDKEISRYKVQ